VSSFFADAFFGLNEAGWTAVAATIALIAVILGICSDALKGWMWGPVLNLDVASYPNYSSNVAGSFWVRIPISNKEGKLTALNVEVYLKSLVRHNSSGHPSPVANFVPMRLKWTSNVIFTNPLNPVQSAICGRIPGGTHRLIDLGYLDGNTPSEFHFATEVLSLTSPHIVSGNYQMKLVVSSDGSSTKEYSVTLAVPYGSGGQPSVQIGV
jgi:hypothetical protein